MYNSNAIEIFSQAQLDEQARLLAERGMVLVGGLEEDEDGGGGDGAPNGHVSAEEQESRTRAIVSAETAAVLAGLGTGPLDSRIKRLADERDDLQVRLDLRTFTDSCLFNFVNIYTNLNA